MVLISRLLLALILSTPLGLNQAISQDQKSNDHIDELIRGTKTILFSNPDSALLLTSEIITLTAKDSPSLHQSQAYRLSGIAYDIKGEYHKSLEMYVQAKQIAQNIGDSVQLANVYLGQGIIFHRFNDHERALVNYRSAYKLYENHKEFQRQSAVLNNIGAIYNDIGLYTKALHIYQRVFKIAHKLQDTSRIASAHSNIAHSYIGLNRLDSAIVHNKKALELNRIINDEYALATAYQTTGAIYKHLYLLDSAKQYLRKAMNPNDQVNLEAEKSTIYITLSEIADLQHQDELSLRLLDSALAALPNQGQEYERFVLIYKAKGDKLYEIGKVQEAAIAYSKALNYNDSLANEDLENMLMSFELDSKTTAYKREINEAKEVNEGLMNENELKTKFLLWALIGSGLLIALIIALYIAWWSRDLYLKVLAKRNEELESDLENSKRMLSVLAHDFRSPLSSVLSMVELLSQESMAEAERKAFSEKAKRNISTTLKAIDELLYWITRDKKIVKSEKVVIRDAVEDALSIHQLELDDTKANIELLNLESMEINFDPAHFDIIVRNLVNNSLKHINNEGNITVKCDVHDDHFDFIVADDGEGISQETLDLIRSEDFKSLRPKRNRQGSGLGLELVYDLAKLNNSTVSIESTEDQGTTVTVSIPA